MGLISVSYDLQSPGQSYQSLYDQIESLGIATRAFDSYWFVNTTLSVKQVFDRLRLCMDDNDMLFIDVVSNQHHGWLDKKTCDWLSSQSQAV